MTGLCDVYRNSSVDNDTAYLKIRARYATFNHTYRGLNVPPISSADISTAASRFFCSATLRARGHFSDQTWLRPPRKENLLIYPCLWVKIYNSGFHNMFIWYTRDYVANNLELCGQNCLRYLANNFDIKLSMVQPRPLDNLRISVRPQTPSNIFLFRKTLAQCYILRVFLRLLRRKYSSLSTSNHHHCQADLFADET